MTQPNRYAFGLAMLASALVCFSGSLLVPQRSRADVELTLASWAFALFGLLYAEAIDALNRAAAPPPLTREGE